MNKLATLADDVKQQISTSFGDAASYYDAHGQVQQEVAKRLIASLQPWRDIIPGGPIIELGCGTGFVTEGLAEMYPKKEIQVTDLSEEMVSFCKQKFDQDNLIFRVQDAEQPPNDEPHYAMTISGFTAQWFKDPAQTLGRWLQATKPGGLLLTSFPGNESFPEWREKCEELGLPFTANDLPDVEEMVVKMSVGPAQVDYYEDRVTQRYESARDFFRDLKKLGAGTQRTGRSLTPKELSLLINHWDESTDGDIKVSYHVVFLAVKRDYDS
ncbi:MAG: methyltransferase domain-containing protein [Fodinibius sp.]|nr:methyltransferase domain-containing protein [Fodinibius sp.]